MPLTEESYEDITAELEPRDFAAYGYGNALNLGSLNEDLEELAQAAKPALAYQLDDETEDSLMSFLAHIEDVRYQLEEKIQELQEVNEKLEKAEDLINNAISNDDDE